MRNFVRAYQKERAGKNTIRAEQYQYVDLRKKIKLDSFYLKMKVNTGKPAGM